MSSLDHLDPEAAAAALAERLRLYRIAKEGAAHLRALLAERGYVWLPMSGLVRTRGPQTELPTRTPW